MKQPVEVRNILIALVVLLVLAACNNNDSNTGNDGGPAPEPAPPIIGYTVVNTYPHDTGFYTEGLEFYEGQLLESSGAGSAEGDGAPPYPSAFGVADLKTGKVDRKVSLDNAVYFGEGITVLNGKIYQLTWQNHKGYIYDAKTYKKLQEFSYPGQGWALTHDSTHLIMSDGSSNLQVINPADISNTIKVQSIIGVMDNNGPVSNINELEYANGFIYANQYTTNYILKIDASNGKVVAKLDLSNLEADAKRKYANAEYLNGIAYHAATNTFYVTGKLWPNYYEIKF
ncbi:MAG TPA: glutaminyl-peptide cyclotransferase [Chitinophagaceae bacterium]|nr:glutaminyl-peptide cyclotransferase [Chitinophagaceae bacterium]